MGTATHRLRTLCAPLAVLLLGVMLVLPAQAHAALGTSYAALGDSVAAGAGLTTYGARAAACGRSMSAYPAVLADAEGLNLKNYTCSGARVDNLYDETQQRAGYTYGPQIRNAFARGTPDIMTITIGANDLRWNQFLYNCYTNDDECGTVVADSALVGLRWDLRRELRVAMQDIAERSNNTYPEVYVTGYFNPVKPAMRCTDTEGLSAKEMRWINKQVGLLNTSLRQVANEYSFATFVPVSFAGHELCSDEPWVQGREAVENGGIFHPNAKGQQAYARAIQRAM